MIKVVQPQFTRIHYSAPSKEDISFIQKEYDFHELIIEDMLELSGENKVEYYEDENIVSLLINYPKYNTQSEKYIHNSCVIVVSEKYVLSVSKYSSKYIEKFATVAEQKNYLE